MKKEIVLLHGALGSSEQFQPLQKKLDENYVTYSFDLSGHGNNSDIIGNFSIEFFAEELKNFITKNNLTKPYIFGYSMGGYIALYLESHFPGTFEKIMTLATKYYWNPEISERETKMLNPQTIESKIPDFAKELHDRHSVSGWKYVLSKTSEMMIELGKKPVLNKNILENVSCNCLICIGDKDKMVSIEETIDLYISLKNANMLVIPNTFHPIEKVSINRLVYEITNFFN